MFDGTSRKIARYSGKEKKKVSIGIHDLSKIEGPFTYDICSPHEPAFVPLQKIMK